MAKDERSFKIEGPIGEYYYGSNYVQYMLRELGADPLTVYVSSLGGDLNEALKIKKAFADHGEVTVEYYGFNASSSTIIGHGAKKTVINEDSAYMIHKPMLGVELWGRMNEDELAQAIEELQQMKADAQTVTKIIVQDYVNCRGIDIEKVLDLVKSGRWISASEAVDLGLVDEMKPSKQKKAAKVTNQATIAMMTAIGLPLPEMSDPEKTPDEKSPSFIASIFPKNKKTIMNKDFTLINQALSVEGLEVKDGSISMTVEQVLSLNAKIHACETAITSERSEKDSAVLAKNAAESALATMLENIDTLDPMVKAAADADGKFLAVKTVLAQRPGVLPAAPQGNGSQNNTGEKDATDWDTINNLPHNQAVDKGIL